MLLSLLCLLLLPPHPASALPLPEPNADSASGVRARLNILFSSLCFLLLMPFLSTSLLAGGKEAFARDAGARLYSPLAYYTAKVRLLWYSYLFLHAATTLACCLLVF